MSNGERPRIKYCTSCGKQLGSGNRFCTSCGRKIGEQRRLGNETSLEMKTHRQQFLDALYQENSPAFNTAIARLSLEPKAARLRVEMLNQQVELQPRALVALARRGTEAGTYGDQLGLLRALANHFDTDISLVLQMIERTYGWSVDAAKLCRDVIELVDAYQRRQGTPHPQQLTDFTIVKEIFVDAIVTPYPDVVRKYMKDEIKKGTHLPFLVQKLERTVQTPLTLEVAINLISKVRK